MALGYLMQNGNQGYGKAMLGGNRESSGKFPMMDYSSLADRPWREPVFGEILETICEGVYFIDIDGVIELWNKGAERITGYSCGEVVGKDSAEYLLRYVDAMGIEDFEKDGPLAIVIKEGRGPREIAAFLHHRDGHRVPVFLRAIPIFGPDKRLIGALGILSDRSERSSLIAELENLKKEVLTDALTGLGNRRYADICAASAFREFDAEGKTFGILLIDIDHFKAMNDSYGHAMGDRALRMVGWTLANAVRRSDAAARWGGDEFLVVCPRTDRRVLAEVAERVRILTERARLTAQDGRRASVNVSIGGAVVRAGDDFDSLVARADERMYASKKAGRNRASVAE
jgi:diguanylate cyclase (GGDEF)-like protein/PAS domain S-box-containing protein